MSKFSIEFEQFKQLEKQLEELAGLDGDAGDLSLDDIAAYLDKYDIIISNLKLKDNMLALDSSAEGVSGNILAYGHLKGTFTSE